MPLSPESKTTNITKSLVAWIQTQLVTGAGLSVFYTDAPIATRPNTWVQVDILLGLRHDFGRQMDSTRLGGRGHGFLNLQCCQKRESITNLYGLQGMADSVRAAFQEGQAVTLRDYDTGGTPVIGLVIIGPTTEAYTDNGLESGVMVRALSIGVSYSEAYTLV